MICTKTGLEYKYDFSDKKFQTAFEFLKRKDLATLPEGSMDIGNGVRALIQRYDTMKWEDRNFETHNVSYEMAQYSGVSPETSAQFAFEMADTAFSKVFNK